MEIKAVYDQNEEQLILPGFMRLKNRRVPVRVIIPDEEIMAADVGEVEHTGSKTDQILAEINALLGPDYKYIDDGRTDKERFAEEITRSGRW